MSPLINSYLQVREIITKNLSTDDVTAPPLGAGVMSSVGSEHLREENRMLQTELNRVEDLLAASRAERDEIGIKYNALSERVSPSYSGYSQGCAAVYSLR